MAVLEVKKEEWMVHMCSWKLFRVSVKGFKCVCLHIFVRSVDSSINAR